jgi:hypothetical protein
VSAAYSLGGDGLVGALSRHSIQNKAATRTFEKLVGVKSFEQAIEIHSAYAKRAYDSWVAEATKLGEMYADVAREAYKPVEKAVAKKVS